MNETEIYFHSCSGLGMVKAKVNFGEFLTSTVSVGPLGVVTEGPSSGSFIYYNPNYSGGWIEETWELRRERCQMWNLPLPPIDTSNPIPAELSHVPTISVVQEIALKSPEPPLTSNVRNVRFEVWRHTGQPHRTAVVCGGPTSGNIAMWKDHQWWEVQPAVEIIKEETSGHITISTFRRASRFVCREDSDSSNCS